MNKMEKWERVNHLKNETNSAKDRLISIEYELEEIGAIREAQTLSTIISKLEAWQNK